MRVLGLQTRKMFALELTNDMWYFGEMGTNFYDTNGEYVEAVQYSLGGHEDKRKLER